MIVGPQKDCAATRSGPIVVSIIAGSTNIAQTALLAVSLCIIFCDIDPVPASGMGLQNSHCQSKRFIVKAQFPKKTGSHQKNRINLG
ncbi:hypothetical protein RV134_250090 [Roseovarius sp. EC-HK134]|nr:hypothetical protein RV420_280070 [Roseovarius sp. EC-SD190]VVT05556.1 hypothetical protein RV134_250090 [Roseovarius sp. EC-HK134]